MVWAGVIFFLACIGVTALFILRRWENEHGRVLLPGLHHEADLQALKLKMVLFARTRDVEKIVPFLFRLLQRGVRAAAIAFGHLAHWIGERSHALADLVSHKYRFERRETRSEFLKQVIAHPMHARTPIVGNESFQVVSDVAQVEPVKEAQFVVPENPSSVFSERGSLELPKDHGGEVKPMKKKMRRRRRAPKIEETALVENENI